MFSKVSLYVIAALAALCLTLFGLWQVSSAKFDAYKAEVKLAGVEAEAEAERVKAQHKKALEEVENDWMARVGPAKKDAVDAYIARYGHAATCRLPSTTGEVRVPGDANSPEVLHGAEQERMATDEAFVGTCTEDALFRIEVRTWVEGNGLKVSDAP